MTIDADTAALLQEEVARTGLSFKQVLNQAVRRALAPRARSSKLEPLFQHPFPPGLQNFNHLSDDWDDEETLREINS